MTDNNHRVKIAKNFGIASRSYDASARLQRYSGKHLMNWLPNDNQLTVLDLGSGTGFFTNILAGKYQHVIGLDMSKRMLNFANEQRTQNITWIAGDAYNIPLQDNSVDLVYSNLMIQWCNPISVVLKEVLRVLKPGGMFIFSTLVDGTLYELKSSWAQVDDDKHVIDFKGEKEIIGCLNSSNSKVVEHHVKNIVLEYENVLHLAHELKGLGANQVSEKANKGLAGKEKWQQMTKSYEDFQEPSGIYPATYNVFSGVLVNVNNGS